MTPIKQIIGVEDFPLRKSKFFANGKKIVNVYEFVVLFCEHSFQIYALESKAADEQVQHFQDLIDSPSRKEPGHLGEWKPYRQG
jgi:hypothetical protein